MVINDYVGRDRCCDGGGDSEFMTLWWWLVDMLYHSESYLRLCHRLRCTLAGDDKSLVHSRSCQGSHRCSGRSSLRGHHALSGRHYVKRHVSDNEANVLP